MVTDVRGGKVGKRGRTDKVKGVEEYGKWSLYRARCVCFTADRRLPLGTGRELRLLLHISDLTPS
jgi:hypothetical protein